MSNEYTAENIKHLDTRNAMRQRIQMYLGSDDTDGIYQAFKEIINNSTDEALAGYGNKISIQVDEEHNFIQNLTPAENLIKGLIKIALVLMALVVQQFVCHLKLFLLKVLEMVKLLKQSLKKVILLITQTKLIITMKLVQLLDLLQRHQR